MINIENKTTEEDIIKTLLKAGHTANDVKEAYKRYIKSLAMHNDLIRRDNANKVYIEKDKFHCSECDKKVSENTKFCVIVVKD